MRQLSRFLQNEQGTSVIEYAFIASLVSIAAIEAMILIGGRVSVMLEKALAGFY